MIRAVVFDLGNTLITYYTREQFPLILERCIRGCGGLLESGGVPTPDRETISRRVKEQDHGSPGDRVYPLEGRLSYIFGVDNRWLLDRLCDEFMAPIIETGHLHDDVKPVLSELRDRGYAVYVLSNTPWGCASRIWKGELERHGISEFVDTMVCCYDVGWRKPDPRVFGHLLDLMDFEPGECLFVGDDLRRDVQGSEAMGMMAQLIDRTGEKEGAIRDLYELMDILPRI